MKTISSGEDKNTSVSCCLSTVPRGLGGKDKMLGAANGHLHRGKGQESEAQRPEPLPSSSAYQMPPAASLQDAVVCAGAGPLRLSSSE